MLISTCRKAAANSLGTRSSRASASVFALPKGSWVMAARQCAEVAFAMSRTSRWKPCRLTAARVPLKRAKRRKVSPKTQMCSGVSNLLLCRARYGPRSSSRWYSSSSRCKRAAKSCSKVIFRGRCGSFGRPSPNHHSEKHLGHVVGSNKLKGFCEGTKRALSQSAALSRKARFLSQLWVFSCRAASRKSTTALKLCSSAAAFAVDKEAGCAALLSLCSLRARPEATNSRTCSKLYLKAATCCTKVGTAVGSMPIGVSKWLRCSTF